DNAFLRRAPCTGPTPRRRPCRIRASSISCPRRAPRRRSGRGLPYCSPDGCSGDPRRARCTAGCSPVTACRTPRAGTAARRSSGPSRTGCDRSGGWCTPGRGKPRR
ncbi:unnamed protein product, partial [Ectocarpus sp. 12 AP-2014]